MKKLTLLAFLFMLIFLVSCSNDAVKGQKLSPGWPENDAPIYPSGIIINQRQLGSDETLDKADWVEFFAEEDYDKVIDYYKNHMQTYENFSLNYDDYDGDRMSTITAKKDTFSIKVNISAKKQDNYSTCIVDIYLYKIYQ